ncbi:hypothetical protein C2845_PM03G31000 [Panicum miliaceum]|uniref:Protein FAR1-RELATED SEQUENCE n=1 Tax=Panicum miliaceum TaxID=4540 RepID=A0A3L6T9K1_PANMI|nr:hypothetical protein C2845_PM03G31000 [Panicum miliaceum]
MHGKAPVSIITDQDGAMRCAIAQIFPNTTIKNCRWHIMDKFSSTIGPILDEDAELKDDFKECMNYTVTPDEFEAKWSDMVGKYNLQQNVHYQRLYAIHSSFVPAYFMHSFYPFLQSTQRSGGFNAVQKKYGNPNMLVLNFVKQYQKIQDKFLVAQDGQDFRTDDKDRRRWSRYPIEKHTSAVYTKNLFYRFSKEFEKIAEYDVTPEGRSQYWLVPNNKFVYGYGKRKYLVTVVVEEENLDKTGCKNIPQRYILTRWTQEAIPENVNIEPNVHVPADFIARGMPLNSKRTLWFTNISTASADLAVEGCVSKETYTIRDTHIKMMKAEIDVIKQRKKSKARRARGANQASPIRADGDNVAANLAIIAPSDSQSVPDPIVQNMYCRS